MVVLVVGLGRLAALRLGRKRAATARWESARGCVAETAPVVAGAGLVVAADAGVWVRWCGRAPCSIGFVMSCSPLSFLSL